MRNSRNLIILIMVFFLFMSVGSVLAQVENENQNSTNKITLNKNDQSNIDKLETSKEVVVPKGTKKAKQKGDNLLSTVKQGGPMMIVLLLLGIGAMTIVVERIIFFTRNRGWNDIYVEEFLTKTSNESNAVYREDLEDEMRNVYQLYSNAMERGLALLSGIGNLSPIVGFLGTVIGMISAFASIAAATTVNAKVVAVGIQIALVTTAGGLLVAAPALAMYYFFVHTIQNRFLASENIISQETNRLPRLTTVLEEDK